MNKSCCQTCKLIVDGKEDLSRNTSLMTVMVKEAEEGKSLYVFFCKSCYQLLCITLSMENPMDDDISIFKEEMTEEFIQYFALALWAENRREEVEQRRSFLKNRMMPLYEPINEKEFESILKSQNEKGVVVRTPHFPEWYDNVEDLLDSMDEEEEWSESFSFSYAEPIDLHIISSPQKSPRYYRTYLVPANEIEPLLRIELNEPSRLSLWKQTVSRIEKIAIWDEQEGKTLNVEDFISKVSKDELFRKGMSEQEKEARIKPYVSWIKEEFKINAVAK